MKVADVEIDRDATRDAIAKIIIFYCSKPGIPDVQVWADDIAEQCVDAIATKLVAEPS